MPAKRTTGEEAIRLEAALSGILALLADQRERSGDDLDPPTEMVLAQAGLSNEEIGSVLGKRADSVRKAVERARKRRS